MKEREAEAFSPQAEAGFGTKTCVKQELKAREAKLKDPDTLF